MAGIKEWTNSYNNLIWGYGNWPDEGFNPHNSLIQSLLEEDYQYNFYDSLTFQKSSQA